MADVYWQSWKADDLINATNEELAKRLNRAAIHLQNEIKKLLGVKGRKCNKATGERSAPDESPRLECGQLRRSIAWEVDKEKLVARVGTNLKYGKFLELGTSKMAARPFLRPALSKNHDVIARILAGEKIKF